MTTETTSSYVYYTTRWSPVLQVDCAIGITLLLCTIFGKLLSQFSLLSSKYDLVAFLFHVLNFSVLTTAVMYLTNVVINQKSKIKTARPYYSDTRGSTSCFFYSFLNIILVITSQSHSFLDLASCLHEKV